MRRRPQLGRRRAPAVSPHPGALPPGGERRSIAYRPAQNGALNSQAGLRTGPPSLRARRLARLKRVRWAKPRPPRGGHWERGGCPAVRVARGRWSALHWRGRCRAPGPKGCPSWWPPAPVRCPSWWPLSLINMAGSSRPGPTASLHTGVAPCCKCEVLHRVVGKDRFCPEMSSSKDWVGGFDGQGPVEEE